AEGTCLDHSLGPQLRAATTQELSLRLGLGERVQLLERELASGGTHVFDSSVERHRSGSWTTRRHNACARSRPSSSAWGSEYSSGEWLMPPRLATKIITEGT